MSPTSCRCSTPRRERARKRGRARARTVRGGVPRARAAFSRELPPKYFAGAGGGHDRVRDGTGWIAAAIAHARHPAPHHLVVSRAKLRHGIAASNIGTRHTGRRRRGPPVRAAKKGTAHAHAHRSAPTVARLPRAAAQPGGLPGGLPAQRQERSVISRWGSHLDALSGSPIPTWLPGGAALATTGTPAVGPARSSRTRASAGHRSDAHGG
jgi:hypothetical protein